MTFAVLDDRIDVHPGRQGSLFVALQVDDTYDAVHVETRDGSAIEFITRAIGAPRGRHPPRANRGAAMSTAVEVEIVVLRDDALAYLDVWPGGLDQPEPSVYVEARTDTLSASQARDLAASLLRAAGGRRCIRPPWA